MKEYTNAFLETDIRTDQISLLEKRNFVYQYGVLDLVGASAMGTLGNNKVILVMNIRENTVKSDNIRKLFI